MKRVKVQYLDDSIVRLRYIEGKSDWVDLRAAGNAIAGGL